MSNELGAATLGVSQVRLPSIGACSAPLVVSYIFGIARSASYLGRYADVKCVLQAATTDDGGIPVGFMRQSGMQSSDFEGLAFDLTFHREASFGGSAARFIKRTLEAGGAVHRFTAENIGELGALALPAHVKKDISNAIAAGKEAIVSDSTITTGSWSGIGYIIADPITGAAAYLIDGGFNGGTDDAACAGEGATAPAAEPMAKTSFGAYPLYAMLAVLMIGAAVVVGVGVAMALAGVGLLAACSSGPVSSASPLSAAEQRIWQQGCGKAVEFPSGPTYPGNGIEPPGECSRTELDGLEDIKDKACSKDMMCWAMNAIQEYWNKRSQIAMLASRPVLTS